MNRKPMTDEIVNSANNSFDTIVVGSGIGGLTTAALLARLDDRSVLVLERHHTLGGFTHSFERQGEYTWDVGVHYVGGMSPGSRSRKLMDFVSEDRLEWSPLPDPHDVFVYPDEQFGVPSDREAYRNKLVERFPNEKTGVDRYFRQVQKAANWYRRRMMADSLPDALRWPLDLYNRWAEQSALRPTEDCVAELTDNEKLRSLLVSNWGDYGLLPSESAFAVHAIVTASYFDGAYYPVGSSERIADSIVPTIEAAGGSCLVNREVEEVLVDNGRATGVRVRNLERNCSETFRAETVISDAGAATTYRTLLSNVESEAVDQVVGELDSLPSGRSFVTLYLGLEKSPGSLGVEGENYWINNSWSQSTKELNPYETLRGDPDFAFLSFGPENDLEAEHSTAQVITTVPYEAFESWADETWPRRDDEYGQLKTQIGDGLLELAEGAVPGLADLVEYREVSTPLSIEHFTSHHEGAPYGVPAVPDRYRSRITGVRTPIRNLYLTGADAGCPGVMGAAFSGLFVAGRAIGDVRGPLKVLNVIR